MSEQVLITKSELNQLLEAAATRGAQAALGQLGIHDAAEARADIEELRGLLESWRAARRQFWATVVKTVTSGFLVAVLAGVWLIVNEHRK